MRIVDVTSGELGLVYRMASGPAVVMRSGDVMSVVELVLLAVGCASPRVGGWVPMVRRKLLGAVSRYFAKSKPCAAKKASISLRLGVPNKARAHRGFVLDGDDGRPCSLGKGVVDIACNEYSSWMGNEPN